MANLFARRKASITPQEQLKGILLSGKIAVIWIAEFCLPSQLGQQPLWNEDLFYLRDFFAIRKLGSWLFTGIVLVIVVDRFVGLRHFDHTAFSTRF
jgi:hypothetical protein